jgi:hypothetical protein
MERSSEGLHQALTDAADHIDDAKAAARKTSRWRLPLRQRALINRALNRLDGAEHDLFDARNEPHPDEPPGGQLRLGRAA